MKSPTVLGHGVNFNILISQLMQLVKQKLLADRNIVFHEMFVLEDTVFFFKSVQQIEIYRAIG